MREVGSGAASIKIYKPMAKCVNSNQHAVTHFSPSDLEGRNFIYYYYGFTVAKGTK